MPALKYCYKRLFYCILENRERTWLIRSLHYYLRVFPTNSWYRLKYHTWAFHISSSLTFVLNVYSHSPRHQDSTGDIGRLSSVKYWFQHNSAAWNIRMQSHYHVMSLSYTYTVIIQKQVKNVHKYSTTRKAVHFCPLGPHCGETHMRETCPQCAFTDTDYWPLHGGDLLYKLTLQLASSPLSNKFKMLFSAFYLHGFSAPHLPPTRPLTWCIFDRAVDHFKKLSTMAGTIFVIL